VYRKMADKFYRNVDRYEVISLHVKKLNTKGTASFPMLRARSTSIEGLYAQ